jgi:hypothetical protein
MLQLLAAEEGWDMFQVLAEYHTNKEFKRRIDTAARYMSAPSLPQLIH